MPAASLQFRHTNAWAAGRRRPTLRAATLHTGEAFHGAQRNPWIVPAGTLAAIAVAATMGTSAVVFSEPAVADILMAAVIVGLPLLGVTRYGHATVLNLVVAVAF